MATGINDAGAVVGNAKAQGQYPSRAFVSRYGGRGTWLPSGGRAAEAAAVSRNGWVVGSVVKAGTVVDHRPVRWSPASRMYALPVQNEQPWQIRAVKVNSSGTILGWIDNWINDGFWTSWTADGAGGSFAAQEYRLGAVNLAPSDISDAGTIVGSITAKVFAPASRGSLAAVLAPGQPRVFPELSASTESRATAISPKQRYLVGSVWQKGSTQRVGVYYRWWNTPVKLGYSAFDPTDVNDAAVIVGTKPTGSTTTAMWLGCNQAHTLAAMTRNLPSGWRLTEAVALNARGDVAVTAVAPSGRTFAARLRVS